MANGSAQLLAQAIADGKHEFKSNQCVRDKHCLQCDSKVVKKKWGHICRCCGAFVCSLGCVRTYTAEHQCSTERCLDLSITQRVEESRADRVFEQNSEALANQLGPQGAERSEKQLLDEITSRPAPKLLHHVPQVLEARALELLRDALSAHADAE
eukprot:3901824-Karenia_brevis.AAC.1